MFRSARLAGRAFRAPSAPAPAAPSVVNYGVIRGQPAAAADLENAIAGSTAPIFEPQVVVVALGESAKNDWIFMFNQKIYLQKL